LSVDEVTLKLPRDPSFYPVVHLVLGGLASRMNLTWENLQDLEVALDSLLERGEGDVTIALRVREDAIQALVGPVDSELEEELGRDPGREVGLRRILDTVVDRVEITERDGQPWVDLTKRFPVAAGSEA